MTLNEIKILIQETIAPNGQGAITAASHQALLLQLADFISQSSGGGSAVGARGLYEACGAVYNEDTGYYELNGLTDITEAQMAAIYVATKDYPEKASFSAGTSIRTNICRRESAIYYDYNLQVLDNYFNGCADMEVAKVAPAGAAVKPQTMLNAFGDCTALREVAGTIDLSSHSDAVEAFNGCSALEEVRLSYLYRDVYFTESPNLSKASILHMVSYSLGNFIINLHADAYARLSVDAEVIAAIEEFGITLVA